MLFLTLVAAEEWCSWPSGFAQSGPYEDRFALVVRGHGFRDCGHGKVCDAVGPQATLACAESHMSQFVRPLRSRGYVVDIYLATYECSWHSDWLDVYGDVIQSVRAPELAESENQLDSLLRALRLLNKRYKGVLITRTDLLFLTDLSHLDQKFYFHADMTRGATYDGLKAENVTANTDKLFWVPAPAMPCFLDAVVNIECFANYDDDDPQWISGERCYPTIEKRVGKDRIGFLRDDVCPPTKVGTFGDNLVGDGCYLVLPRALKDLAPSERRKYVDGPYLTGRCHRSVWRSLTDLR